MTDDVELPAHLRPYTRLLDDLFPKLFADVPQEMWPESDAVRRMRVCRRDPGFLEQLFSSVYRRYVDPSQVSGAQYKGEGFGGEVYQHWTHRAPVELDRDMRELHVDVGALCTGVAQYVKHPELQHEFLDWYCADALTYGRYLTVVEDFEYMLGGWISRALSRADGMGAKIAGCAVGVSWFLIKWAIWLFLLLMVADSSSSTGVAAFIGVTAAWQVFKWRRRNKFRRLLAAMRAAYDVFQTQTYSWEIAWAELNRSRELGVTWPGELYKLVETRKAAPR